MLNVLLPMAGSSAMFDPHLYPYPLPLTEVCGKPLIEHVIGNLSQLDSQVRFIFVVKAEDCRRFHLDHTLALLAPGSKVVMLHGDTQGALCSALMGIAHITPDEPLVIANVDQLIEPGLQAAYAQLVQSGADAGCLTFESVHPRWSYVKVADGQVIEAAEKKPISRNAIAGFYYFSRGDLFTEAAKKSLLNHASVGDLYFVSPVFNELILDGRLVKAAELPADQYFSFYTPQRIEEYERHHTLSGAVAQSVMQQTARRPLAPV